jgi:membrane-associated phospholipid phosphatase
MDFTIDHAVNTAMRAHPLLVSIASGFANWAVIAFGVTIFLLWLLDAPRKSGLSRRAAASGLGAAALGLGLNQLVILAWDRPRPYEAHPRSIVPLIAPSHDPSFPSDHATAAFSIAFGVLFVARRAGLFFLAWAALIAASRVVVGVHYPTDVLAGLVIGLASGYAVARLAPLMLDPVVRLVARLTDPVLERVEATDAVQRTVGSARVRELAVTGVGIALLTVFAVKLKAHLLDELPLAALAAWAGVVALAAWIAGRARRPLAS